MLQLNIKQSNLLITEANRSCSFLRSPPGGCPVIYAHSLASIFSASSGSKRRRPGKAIIYACANPAFDLSSLRLFRRIVAFVSVSPFPFFSSLCFPFSTAPRRNIAWRSALFFLRLSNHPSLFSSLLFISLFLSLTSSTL